VTTCPEVTSLGVYVLGAVDDAERERVDAHLAACAECRRELDALLPLPRYLAQLAPDEAAALEEVARPPAGLLTRVRAAQVVSRHRLVRQRIAVAAAVVVALVLAVLVARQDGASPAPVVHAAAHDAGSGVRAAVDVAARPSGTALTLRLRGVTPGERCRLVVLGRDGRSEVAATWQATYLGTADVTGATAIPEADVSAVDVVTSAGRRLVHVPIEQENPS
jgi:hypothetical protein